MIDITPISSDIEPAPTDRETPTMQSQTIRMYTNFYDLDRSQWATLDRWTPAPITLPPAPVVWVH